MKNYLRLFVILAILINISFAQVTPTNEWVNFYSTNTTFDGSPVPVGAVIEAYDPDGVLCGSFTVTTEGQYGFLLVYKDDFTTSAIDEGADPGDTITFYINSTLVIPVNGNTVWTSNGDVIRLDLQTYSNFPPSIISLPDTVSFDSESFITLYLDDYAEDADDPDSLLTWSASGYDSLDVQIDPGTRIATISSVNNWSGWDLIIIKVSDPAGAFDTDTITVHVLPVVGVDPDTKYMINTFHLSQNYPNPFNPTTRFEYRLPEQTDVRVIIFGITGSIVKEWNYPGQESGNYSVLWDGTNMYGNKVSTGIYFYRIIAGNYLQTKKMVLVK